MPPLHGSIPPAFCAQTPARPASQLAAEGLAPDVILLDPPRKGCDVATLDAVCTMAPRRVVMISCNPATAARMCVIWQTAVTSRNGSAVRICLREPSTLRRLSSCHGKQTTDG